MKIKKAFIYKVFRAIYLEFKNFPQVLKFIFAGKNSVCITSWIFTEKGQVSHHNWGDDINKFFFEYITGKTIVNVPLCKLVKYVSKTRILAIGSLLSYQTNKHTIIWGSGLQYNEQARPLTSSPKKILAVRGPLSRKWLLEQKIDCPEIFGDPALLLPMFYKPKKLFSKKIGIIPHMNELLEKNEILMKFLENKNTVLIKTSDYKNWQDFIDKIFSCDFIISSSLHGIIVSEAYCVPNVWVEFKEHPKDWNFKFHDFYFSVGKFNEKKISLTKDISLEDLLIEKTKWQKGYFNPEPLLNVCPFREDIFAHTGIKTIPDNFVYKNTTQVTGGGNKQIRFLFERPSLREAA